MVSRSEYRALLEWVARNDPNDENREDAARELKVMAPSAPASP
jgi:hypothetical protein